MCDCSPVGSDRSFLTASRIYPSSRLQPVEMAIARAGHPSAAIRMRSIASVSGTEFSVLCARPRENSK